MFAGAFWAMLKATSVYEFATMYEIIRHDTPIGELWLALNREGQLSHAVFGPEMDDRPVARLVHNQAVSARKPTRSAQRVCRALTRYFAGKSYEFDLPIALEGTSFQQAVWAGLLEISAGETRTYAQMAADIDQPRAIRAVGLANRNNPVSIIVPCHRLVGSDGKLRGYAGGIEVKRWLLDHESSMCPKAPAMA
jgi:methylated-DNA-[protein]-cysteine S-methyltransferase